MTSDYRCFFCFARAFEQLIEKENLSIQEKNAFTRKMATLYNAYGNSFSAPAYARDLHTILRSYTHNPDPYLTEKQAHNSFVINLYPALKRQVEQSEDPLDTAFRLAIAGNIIDFAIGSEFDIPQTIEKVLHTPFAIDHSAALKDAIAGAKTILYLGDNAGEIVFDKLLIETINHPNLYFAVRGSPVMNDATLDDAHEIGMDKVANVISNGYDAPSTIVDCCSESFQQLFCEASLILSKGQGNLEGLLGKTEKEIFFLLMVKCNVIAETLQVKKGDFVIM